MPRDKLHIENKDTALQNLFLCFQAKVRLTNDILFIESLIAPTEPRLFYVNNFEVHIFVLNMNVKPKRLTTPGTVKLTQRDKITDSSYLRRYKRQIPTLTQTKISFFKTLVTGNSGKTAAKLKTFRATPVKLILAQLEIQIY